MKDSVVIGGTGMVGHATMFALGTQDYYAKNTANIELKKITDYKYIYICLPTPTIDGKQDLSTIKHYLNLIKDKYQNNVVIIRSTVLPGSCEQWEDHYKIKIVHVPEFLTESTWMDDTKWPDIVVVGANNSDLRDEVAEIFKTRYKGADFYLTDTITSEMIKYAINCFYATKVIYANSLFDFSNNVGANYETIKQAMYARKFMSKNHFDIWHKGGRGGGGKCLNKDIEAFANYTELPFFKMVNKLNKELLVKYPKNEK